MLKRSVYSVSVYCNSVFHFSDYYLKCACMTLLYTMFLLIASFDASVIIFCSFSFFFFPRTTAKQKQSASKRSAPNAICTLFALVDRFLFVGCSCPWCCCRLLVAIYYWRLLLPSFQCTHTHCVVVAGAWVTSKNAYNSKEFQWINSYDSWSNLWVCALCTSVCNWFCVNDVLWCYWLKRNGCRYCLTLVIAYDLCVWRKRLWTSFFGVLHMNVNLFGFFACE